MRGGDFMAWVRARRGVILTLALLALALKVVVPPGYMVAPRANDLPFAIVICTAQGAVTVEPGGATHDTPTAQHDAPCVFAGHGVGAQPPGDIHRLHLPIAAYQPILPPSYAATPGLGLCAPPPPARGPPLSI